MTSSLSYKINSLLKTTPKGVVLTTPWLVQHGFSTKLAWWDEKAGWLERIAHGAYKLAGDHVTWTGAILAIQQQVKLPVHVGGKTALQILGKSHYLHHQLVDICLFAPPSICLPAWLKSSYWPETFLLYSTNLFKTSKELGLIRHETDNQISITLSSPERALFELCYLMPKFISFEEAALIAENLSRLRPTLLQSLLEKCHSIKVKRLILYFGDYFQHSWLNEINVKQINLGKGKRCIAGGGCYNAKYQLSVPEIKTQ